MSGKIPHHPGPLLPASPPSRREKREWLVLHRLRRPRRMKRGARSAVRPSAMEDSFFLVELGGISCAGLVEAAERVEDGFEVVPDLVIGETQDAVAKGLEIGIPIQIVRDLPLPLVNGAVELQNQSHIVAEEIGDIGADRRLSPKFQPEEPAVPQVIPEPVLGIGRGPPKPLRASHRALIPKPHPHRISQNHNPSNPTNHSLFSRTEGGEAGRRGPG